MNIIEIIKSDQIKFSKRDKEIIEFLSNYTDKILEMSLKDLSKELKIGEATIIRFARKLGLTGYNQLKIELSANIGKIKDQERKNILNEDINEEDSNYDIFKKLQYHLNISLDDGINLLDMDLIDLVINKIRGANKILFFGTAFSNLSALDAQYKLMRIGYNVHAYQDPELSKTTVTLMEENDIIIAFSQQGENEQTLNIIRLAKKLGIEIIGITSEENSPFAKEVDYLLLHKKNESIYQGGSLTGTLSQLFIIELIYSKLVLLNKEGAINNKKRTLKL